MLLLGGEFGFEGLHLGAVGAVQAVACGGSEDLQDPFGAGGADLAADMLGHTSSKITKQHYIEPDEKVNPVTAEILEALAPKSSADAPEEEVA